MRRPPQDCIVARRRQRQLSRTHRLRIPGRYPGMLAECSNTARELRVLHHHHGIMRSELRENEGKQVLEIGTDTRVSEHPGVDDQPLHGAAPRAVCNAPMTYNSQSSLI